METGIHIGDKIDAKATVGPLAEAIVKVLGAIDQHRCDRDVALKALDLLSLAGMVEGATISGCSVYGTPPETKPENPYDSDYKVDIDE